MKKIALIGCIYFLVFCAPRPTIQTEGLEEIIVFGEETAVVSEEPVVAPPPITEEAILVPPVEEVVTAAPVTEEVIPPPPYVEEVVPIPPAIEEVTYVPPAPPPVPAPTPAPTVAPSSIYGFRIQIFASSTHANASRVADDARSSLGEKIYVEHIPPYYKVRVGNCVTMAEAIALKNKAVKLGYRGAFIVETMITP